MNILESIFSKDGKLVIATQKDRDSSSADSISTFIRRVPYETGTSYGTVYSVLNYISSDETTSLLNSVKGKGPYDLNEVQLNKLITDVAAACAPLLTRLKVDVIIAPKSSSTLVNRFIDALKTRNKNIVVLTDAFIKKAFDAEKVSALINTDHPAWEKFSSENPGAVTKLERSLAKNVADSGGQLELKKIYKPYAKFIKNFLEMQDAWTVLGEVMEKNVLVIDDVYSSGSTMVEMMRQIISLDADVASVQGLTIFKRTKTKTA